MKEAAVLMRFLRHDPVGQRFGVGALVVAWFALAWTSVAAGVTCHSCSSSRKSCDAGARTRRRSSTTSKICTRRSR